MCSPFPLAPTSTHVEWLNKNSSCVNVSPFFFCTDVSPCCSNWSLNWHVCFGWHLEQLTISRTCCIFWIQFWEVYFQFIVILNKSTLIVPKERPNLLNRARSTYFELHFNFLSVCMATVQCTVSTIYLYLYQQAWHMAKATAQFSSMRTKQLLLARVPWHKLSNWTQISIKQRD